MLTPSDLQQIKKIVSDEVTPLKIDIKTLKSDVVHIRKDIKTIVSFFDHEYLELRKRVDRIEEHLGLPAQI